MPPLTTYTQALSAIDKFNIVVTYNVFEPIIVWLLFIYKGDSFDGYFYNNMFAVGS